MTSTSSIPAEFYNERTEPAWNLHGTYTEHAWNLHGTYTEPTRNLHGFHQASHTAAAHHAPHSGTS